jgi:hypothetical protein
MTKGSNRLPELAEGDPCGRSGLDPANRQPGLSNRY